MKIDLGIGIGDLVTWTLLVAGWGVWAVRVVRARRIRQHNAKSADLDASITLVGTNEPAPGLRCRVAYSVTNRGQHPATKVFLVSGNIVLNDQDPMTVGPGITKAGSVLTSGYSGTGCVAWIDGNGHHDKQCCVDISALPSAPPGYLEALKAARSAGPTWGSAES